MSELRPYNTQSGGSPEQIVHFKVNDRPSGFGVHLTRPRYAILGVSFALVPGMPRRQDPVGQAAVHYQLLAAKKPCRAASKSGAVRPFIRHCSVIGLVSQKLTQSAPGG
jgi:hypothetical protein